VIGKAGLEREYNDQLMGVDGQIQVVVDNHGTVRNSLGIKEAVPGKNLQLTLDLDLQVVAELAMEDKTGAVVALDPRNGEVLAMVSTPAYDPNKFAGRIRSADWNELRNNPITPCWTAPSRRSSRRGRPSSPSWRWRAGERRH